MKSFQASLFAVLALSVGSSSAFADLTCPGLSPRPFSVIHNEIIVPDGTGKTVIKGENIDCGKVALGAKVVSGIQQMLGHTLAYPASIAFNMADVYDNAFFYSRDLSLNVPYQIVLGGYDKNPIYTEAVWAHEFGHAVFGSTLANAKSKWYSYIRRRLDPSAGQPADVLEAIIKPYNEYFADVIAVLYSGRGDAVARGLHFTGFVANPEGTPSQCANRSDPKCRPRNNEANDVSRISVNRDFLARSNQLGTWRGVKASNFHNVLAPARFHIWKYYLSNPAIKSAKAQLAAATIDAIMADVNRRLQRVASTPEGFTYDNLMREISDVQRVNQEFIATMDATFAKAF